ncbi:hypothetical protein [Lysobacter gummosus]|uniref:Sel1 repeat family protein n=1 Tax=Lysobacter gummosus TaxID=262324 RepID=A0ABY3XG45_9GAMM|nr:hypothetical protein [Lysobacter gummosus]UNP30616.1 hypothetical protein MOV92_04950 [Lysobacter gummosus]
MKLASEIAKSRPDFVICINRLGAENGDSVSQYNYATRLFEITDEAAQLRGMYWLKKAAAANLEVAKSLLASKQRSK